MKRSFIKELHSPDINLETYSPSVKDNFGFLLQVIVGIEGEQGEECFDVYVCTPKWIEQNYTSQTILIGLHAMIVQEYNQGRLIEAIKELFCKEGSSLSNISCELSYYGLSEMDYSHWSSHNHSVRCGVIYASPHSES